MIEEIQGDHYKWHQQLDKDIAGSAFSKVEAVDHYLRYEEAKDCAKLVEEMTEWALEHGEIYLKHPDVVVPRAMWGAVVSRVAQELWERADSHVQV